MTSAKSFDNETLHGRLPRPDRIFLRIEHRLFDHNSIFYYEPGKAVFLRRLLVRHSLEV